MTYKFKQKSHQHYYDLLEEGLTFHSTRTGHFGEDIFTPKETFS